MADMLPWIRPRKAGRDQERTWTDHSFGMSLVGRIALSENRCALFGAMRLPETALRDNIRLRAFRPPQVTP